MILSIHKTHLPGFGFQLIGEGAPVCICTVLALGGSGNDCAAYQAIIPDLSMMEDEDRKIAHDKVRRGGNKLSEKDALKLFDFTYEGQELTYRR